ncbi:YeiH family protein [Isoptericola aurantiacus]|uniref:YeiH family protein n=1 Tax=Isoptericola aurantiacus TaxID=3377839 RepID=UPI00383A0BFD
MTRLVPGLGIAAGATALLLALAPALAQVAPALSPLVLALLVGAATGSVLGAAARRDAERRVSGRRSTAPGRRPLAAQVLDAVGPGTAWTARYVLRAGVVLLGLQLSLGDVLGLGWRGVAVVALTVTVTFTATLAIGRRLGVGRDATLLVATGFSICGAAAVSAMTGVLDRVPARRSPATDGTPAPPPPGDDPRGDDGPGAAAAVALALVALYGTAAVVALPWLAGLLGLTATQSGLWIGASVQEVAQVVAAAGAVPAAAALATATVAKLARVVLLAPVVATAGAVRARRAALAAPRTGTGSHLLAGGDGGASADGGTRPALVPGFVLGFLGAVVLRSLGVVPPLVLDGAAHATTALFVAAMFALGLGVDVPRLIRTGRRPLLLGACAAVVVTTTALAAVLLLAP